MVPASLTGALAFLAALASGELCAGGPDHTHEFFGRTLSQYVSDGEVNYAGLKRNRTNLDRYLRGLGEVTEPDFRKWTDQQRLAYYLNLYNADTLQLIIDNYPVTSIKKIGSFWKGPWDQPAVKLFGKTITLNNLEHDIIRKQFDDPRVHFALVCAAKGCPPLREEPYVADRMNEQLDDQGRRFLGQSSKNRVSAKDGIVHLSPIFKWYGDDFVKKSGSVLLSVRPFFPEKTREVLLRGKYSIAYTTYDWSLNEAKTGVPRNGGPDR